MMPQDTKYVDVDGAERTILAGKFTYPSWGFDKFTNKPAFMFKQVLIVIEEYGQSDLDLKKALASLVYDRRMGEFHFPGAHVLMLSNRAKTGLASPGIWTMSSTGGPMSSWSRLGRDDRHRSAARLVEHHLAFAARNEDLLFGDLVPDKQGPYLTNRSLEAADEIIRTAETNGMDISHPFIKIGLAGTIGQAATERYMAFAMARSKIPTVANHRRPDGRQDPSELDLTMFLVFASHRRPSATTSTPSPPM